ncbi:KTSC domain-containing protein [Methanoregula sp.]|jgi:hypothetical protein|uniref:KTSC domain-containing protein n=1 Tax=Methanoregula sp. TaxID=2052170 RepID=UPI003C1CADDC
MSLVWNRRLSREIRELGYDIVTGKLIVVFPDGIKRNYGPVTYEMYDALSHAPNPGRLFRQIVEGKIPRIS